MRLQYTTSFDIPSPTKGGEPVKIEIDAVDADVRKALKELCIQEKACKPTASLLALETGIFNRIGSDAKLIDFFFDFVFYDVIHRQFVDLKRQDMDALKKSGAII